MKGKLFILLLSLTFLLVFPGLASAQYGSISGTVTDEVTGLPIMGAYVMAMGDTCHGGGGCGDAVTDSNGFYMIQHLPPGPYLVIASASGYQDEVYPDSIIVVAGQNAPNIDFALTPMGGGGTGSISGRVTDEVTGNHILHAHMIAVGLDNFCFGEAWTDSIGSYLIPQLCAGIWQVRAEAPGYVPEVYPDTVLVIEDQNTPNIDFALTPTGGETGSISGRVTDETTGLPLPMAHIWAYGGSCPPCGAEAWSDTAGYYLIQHLAAAQYVVRVHKDGYLDEVYPESVIVVAGQNTPNIDFALTLSGGGETGSISGRVTDEVSGDPILHAHMIAVGLDNWCFGEAWTDSNGDYLIPQLCAGIWQVRAEAPGYVPEIYPDTVPVIEDQNTPNIDFALTPMGGGTGSISGRVTDEVTGLPIISAEVRLSGMYHDVWYTDTAGYYMCDNVPAGFYLVTVHAMGYYPETYPDSVPVLEGQNTPNINFALTPMGGGTGSISGRVTDSETGLPIPMAHVLAHADSGYHCWGGEAWTDTAGYYLIQNLDAGQYIVGVHKSGYLDAVYPEWVTVLEGQNTPNIDFALTPMGEPGSISGTITDQVTGAPIGWAHIWAYGQFGHGQARTDSLGNYTIFDLYPGSYFVTAWAMHYYPQDYLDTVIVDEGQNTPNIDFALVPFGSPSQGIIAGQVLDDSTLSPIPYAVVFAVSFGGGWGFDFADSTGAYMIQGLRPGNYYVHACAPGYIGEFYDGVYTWEEATLVTPDAYNINFYLGTCGQEGGSISGAISSNGSSLEGAFVYALVSGEVKGFARSSTDGGYIINGLLPGSYNVTASMVMYHDGSYPDPIWVVPGKAGGVNINLPPVVVGDVTGEGSVDLGDVIFLINYLYKNDLAPNPLMTGDLNCDGALNLGDVVYIINYLYKSGSPPCNP
jgi:protocatechuate 3,4-dioxygenase beta subunit